MTYRDIIENNKKISAVSWWVKYAFHYTDVSNAVNILKTGNLNRKQICETFYF